MARYVAEYAKSGRAGCKGCKGKIEQGSLRLGTITAGPGDYDMTAWRHPECQKKPKNLSSANEIEGLAALKAEDQEKVQAWFEASGTKKRSSSETAAEAAMDSKKMKLPEMKNALKSAGVSTEGSKKELQASVNALKE